MKLKTLFLVIAFFMTPDVNAENSAMGCLNTYWDGDDYIFKNICGFNIYVIYCSTDKKMSGKYCGDYKGSIDNKGSYYTHSVNIKVGENRSKWKPGNIKYGACKGMTGFGRSFTDYSDGSFMCEEARRLYD